MTLINFFTPGGPNFALGASYDSILRSQAVACVPVTKNGHPPSAKRDDVSSNSEVHLSEIVPAQV